MSIYDALTPFGWPMVFYLTLAGLACGATLCAVYFLRSEDAAAPGQATSIAKTSLILAVASTLIGTLFLIYDLKSPGQVLLNFSEFNPSSAIAWGTRIITFFILLCIYTLVLLRMEQQGKAVGPLLSGLLVLAALAVGIYPAFVLGQAVARPLWEPLLLFPLFLFLGIHTGFASVQLLTREKWTEQSLHKIRSVDIGIIALQVILFVLLISLAPISSAGKERIFSGDLAPWFWFGVVLIGWLLPFLASFFAQSRRNILIASQLGFLCGAFMLRAVIVFGGQGPQAFVS